MNKAETGSKTAKGGFKNEGDICKKFSNYMHDEEAKMWLRKMGYDYKLIAHLSAFRIPVSLNFAKR